MEKEIWKDVVGWEGLYQVSNLGNVKSISRIVIRKNKKEMYVKEKVLQPYKCSNGGYLSVPLSQNGKRFVESVHRLVAKAFIPNPKQLRDVNHKDGDKFNNKVDNLEWCSHSKNIEHAYRILGHRHVCRKLLCVENGVVYKNSVEAAKALGLRDSSIRGNANKGKGSVHGYHFINLEKTTI